MRAMARGPITFLKKGVLSKMTSLTYRSYLSPSFYTIVILFDRYVQTIAEHRKKM
jgi:hypothetical protein